jgi:SPP1 family predicted phage head-tail adaptor
VGDMQDLIILHDREIKPPQGSSVDYTEEFTENDTVWAMRKTVKPREFFDGTDVGKLITEEFYIRHLDGITAETWIELENIRYDIVHTEPLDGRKEFIRLDANIRGNKSIAINST